MIISRTPFRISFFGGGTDYPAWYLKNGGSVISTTIDKYVYLTVRQLPSFSDSNYRIVWSKVETVNKIKHIQHNVVREMLNNFKLKTGMEVHYQGDLPARSGMGSSSSFVVGLMNSLLNIGMNQSEIMNMLITGQYNSVILEAVSVESIEALYGSFNTPAVGASGAIYGVLVAFGMMYPNAELMLIFLPIPIKAKYFIPLIIMGDLFFGISGTATGVAHFAHIGGALFGFIYVNKASNKEINIFDKFITFLALEL